MKKTHVVSSPKRLIHVDIDGVLCKFKTPSIDQVAHFSAMCVANGNQVYNVATASKLLISWCLREIEADIKVEDENGNIVDFKLEFDKNNYVTMDSLEILAKLPCLEEENESGRNFYEKLNFVTNQLVNKDPDAFYELLPNKDREENPEGKKLPGVTLIPRT